MRRVSAKLKQKLLRDTNLSAHTAHVVQAFLPKHSMTVIDQAPYSPNWHTCYLSLLPKLK